MDAKTAEGSAVTTRKKHSPELQAIRGIAALVVLLFHASIYFQLDPATQAVTSFAFQGSAAVIMFFVLSGFVLTIANAQVPWTGSTLAKFYLRRAFRIYPALWLACALALLYELVSRHSALNSLVSSWWIDQQHPGGLDRRLLVETFAGKATELTLPIWTIFIELVGSALMPLIIAAQRRSNWMLLPIGLALAIIEVTIGRALHDLPLFMFAFCFGACIPHSVGHLARYVTSDRIARVGALVMLALLWTSRQSFGLTAIDPYSASGIIAASLSAFGLLVVVYARPSAFRALAGSGLAWLGDVSYSLYLLHMPIMGFVGLALGAVATMLGVTNVYLLASLLGLLTLAASSLAATLSYRWVENAGIEAGKRMTRLGFSRTEPARTPTQPTHTIH